MSTYKVTKDGEGKFIVEKVPDSSATTIEANVEGPGEDQTVQTTETNVEAQGEGETTEAKVEGDQTGETTESKVEGDQTGGKRRRRKRRSRKSRRKSKNLAEENRVKVAAENAEDNLAIYKIFSIYII